MFLAGCKQARIFREESEDALFVGSQIHAKYTQQLEEVYVEEWKLIPTVVCANLVANYRKRLRAVIKNKCGAVDY